MADTGYSIVSIQERPDLEPEARRVTASAWPAFMLEDAAAYRHWDNLFALFPAYQFVMLDTASEQVIAAGQSAPLAWEDDIDVLPDAGWDWALAQAVEDHSAGRIPRLQSALGISIPAAHRGKSISSTMVRAMKAIGVAHGLRALVAPVRPNLKHRYPLTPMDRYIHWRDAEGLPFDPWMRVHARLGAEIVRVCPESMRIEGSVAEWEQWTEMRFPESGLYVVPQALVPVAIDREADRGTYVEPNVWMCHHV